MVISQFVLFSCRFVRLIGWCYQRTNKRHLGVNQIARTKATAALALIFAAPFTTAAPPVLAYHVRYTTSVEYSYDVASRAAACNELVKLAGYKSAVPKDPWDSDGRWGANTSAIECIATRVDGTTTPVSPGDAYCGTNLGQTDPGNFVVDKTYQVCGCNPATRRYFPETDACINVTSVSSPPPNKPDNLGPQCSRDSPVKNQPQCGEPINPTTGNMWHQEVDYQGASDSLSIVRVYNSSPTAWDAATIRAFGRNWNQGFDSVLRPELQNVSASVPCYQRADTKAIFCEVPTVSAPSPIPDAVSISRSDGKKFYFNRSGTDYFAGAQVNSRLTAIFNDTGSAVVSWRYFDLDSHRTEDYSADGRLIAVSENSGPATRLTYSDGTTNDSSVSRQPFDSPVCSHIQTGDTQPAGRLLCLTDNWGRQLNFEYDQAGRVTRIFDPAGRAYTYEYDGASAGCDGSAANYACNANNLTKVIYPDGHTRTYVYNEAGFINNGAACSGATPVASGRGPLPNALTGLVDENEARFITWTYDCSGRATSSRLGQAANKVTLDYLNYGGGAVLVSHAVGTSASPQTTARNYIFASYRGVGKNTAITDRCVECGQFKTRSYDANGNLATAMDWNGNYVCFSYDLGRNVETARIEGTTSSSCLTLMSSSSLNLPTRKISTNWHPFYRKPLSIAEPKRITTFTYDDFGNVLTRAVQATSDLTGANGFGAAPVGAARVWRYEYNQYGQLMTATGPRIDVADVTTYDYDANGNLATVTNALGQTTTLSGYDDDGSVGSITEPNGTLTELTYTVRGKLASRTVSNGASHQTTSYEYDPVGQLTKVTNPDGSWFTYGYDDAHRLISIGDSLGNSVVYTLDLTGNRIAEQFKDPNGALTRQISRVFNTLNQLTQVTGASQ